VSQISYSGPSVTTTTVVEGSASVTLTGSNMGPSNTAGTLSIAGGSDMACVSSAHTRPPALGWSPLAARTARPPSPLVASPPLSLSL
jgi:hypothetical protein